MQEVELCKPLRSTKFIEKFVNGWDLKMIFYHDCIQGLIIDTKSPGAIVFLTSNTGEENRLVLGRITPHCNIKST